MRDVYLIFDQIIRFLERRTRVGLLSAAGSGGRTVIQRTAAVSCLGRSVSPSPTFSVKSM